MKTCQMRLGSFVCGKPAAFALPVKVGGVVRLAPICEDCARRSASQPMNPETEPLADTQ